MADDRPSQVTVFMDGHEGHRGHVLGHVWPERLLKFVGVLSRMERIHASAAARKTDYEIVEVKKVNPTIVEMKPVPRAKNYDPRPAFDWSLNQLRVIAEGELPDPRLDSQTMGMIANLAKKSDPLAYRKFWINGSAEEVIFDDLFEARARTIEIERRRIEQPFKWYEGSALGTLTGSLRYVDDIYGDRRFAIKPSAGPDRVDCIYPPELEGQLRDLLFHTVQVSGKLRYQDDSPHPKSVEVHELKKIDRREAPHLSKLRGLFRDYDRPDNDLTALLGG